MNARDINESKYILEKLIDKALLDSFVWSIKRRGVYCQQKSLVDINCYKRSELGDMTLLDEMLGNYKNIENLPERTGVSVALVESQLREEYV